MYTRSERATRHVLTVPQAVYHAVRDVRGGIAGFAATYGLNETTLAHKTDPAREGHRLNADELVMLISYTRDPRLLDSLCAAYSDDQSTAIWFETKTAPNKNGAEMFKYFGELSEKFGSVGETLFEALDDHVITTDEAASIKKVGMAMVQSVMTLIARAEQMVGEV